MMSLQKTFTRLCAPHIFTQQRFATTEAVKKTKKAATPTAPPPKRFKTPSKFVSVWTMFISQMAAERREAGEKFALSEAVSAFKTLSEADRAKLVEQLPAAMAERQAIFDDFISKADPNDIREENRIRAQLKRQLEREGKPLRGVRPIVDKNAPQRPVNAYVLYAKQARKAPELEGMPFPEQSKIVGKQWLNLAEDKKEEFEKQAKQMKAEYEAKVEEYYGSS